MEVASFHPSIYTYLFPSRNYVHWTQTPHSHLYSAGILGVRKEEIKVEVEDSRYLIIRTETVAERSFSRKFRLPERVDMWRGLRRRGFFIHPAYRPQTLHRPARAA